jgi:putative ABC transport system substrate-binding protein
MAASPPPDEDMRRFAITLLVVSLGTWPAAAATATHASQPEKRHRIGVIGFHSPGLESRMIAHLQERLLELGYVEGRNLSIVYRWADGVPANYTAIGQALAAEKLDAIVAPCGPAVRAVRGVQPTIPLVVRGIDLTSCGSEIASAERPGGNMTGAIYFSPDATARRLQILKELIPGLSHVGTLYRWESQWSQHLEEVDAAARQSGVRLSRIEWKAAGDLRGALDTALRLRVGALLTLGDAATMGGRHHLAELAAERRLPVLYDIPLLPAAEFVGLISYYADSRTLFRHLAEQVDEILRGKKPGDIPIARPQRFQLFINHEAARSLGLTVPPSLLRRDQ